VVNGGSESKKFGWMMDVAVDYELTPSMNYALYSMNIDSTSTLLQSYNTSKIVFSTDLDPLQIRFFEIVPKQ
jgi:hypothetical protein